VNSRRVRFLLFLCLCVFLAQSFEIVALFGLSAAAPANYQANFGFDFSTLVSSGFWIFSSSVGPCFVFAFAGLFLFNHSNCGLWCWTLCASSYAVLILLGLLCEYGMTYQAAEAAARGSKYMNCGGHPRLFMIIFGLPVMAVSFCLSIGTIFIESVFRVLSASGTQSTTIPNG
jgi:hypothetical protein